MAAQKPPVKNLRQLALKMQFEPTTVHRIFSGKNQHTTLKTYKRIAEICGWNLEEFFRIACSNKPEHTAFILRGRLKERDISVRSFCAYLSDGTTGGTGHFLYLDGSHKYERLSLYHQLKTALGITADTMYEALLTTKPLTLRPESDKLTESASAVSFNLFTIKRTA